MSEIAVRYLSLVLHCTYSYVKCSQKSGGISGGNAPKKVHSTPICLSLLMCRYVRLLGETVSLVLKQTLSDLPSTQYVANRDCFRHRRSILTVYSYLGRWLPLEMHDTKLIYLASSRANQKDRALNSGELSLAGVCWPSGKSTRIKQPRTVC